MKTIAFLRAKILLALGTTAVVFVVLTFLLVRPSQAADGIYKRINFQGKLANLSGTNVSNGNYSVTFTLYDAASNGTNLWDETQTVAVTDGIFRVELGSVDTTLGNVNFNTDTLYLGIKVGSDTEMTPRVRFAAVPYAFNAQKVNGLTVTNTSDAPFASTTTLKIGDGKTVIISNGLTFQGTDSTTFTFPSGSGTVVTLDATQTLTSKTIGSTGLTFSGATTDVTTVSNEDFVLSPNGTGKIGFNTTSPLATLDVRYKSATLAIASISGTTSFATLALDNYGNGDLLVASKAGFNRFVVTNTGNVGIQKAIPTEALDINGNINVNGGVYKIGAVSGAASLSNACVNVTGGIVTSAGTCSGGGSANFNYWTQASGALRVDNPTVDLLVGGTATTSAKFAVLNVAPGLIPVASISAQDTSNNALTLDGNGNIGTTDRTALTLGTTTTGSVALAPGGSTAMYLASGGNVGIGTTAPIGKLNISGDAGGVALVKLNELGSNDPFTASVAGVTKFAIKNSGTIQLDSSVYNAACTALETDASGNILCGTDASGGGGGSASWTIADGATFPNMATVLDVLIGGSATASAKTKFSGTNGGDSFINLTGGNVGIGTSSAREKLTVTGNIRLEAKPVSNTNGTTWTKITSSLPGQIAANGTSGIASISAATVYNGSMYIGTSKNGGGAEVYRYNGTSGSWIRINQAPGQFASNTAINGVTAMTVHNGKLYIGTEKTGQGEVYEMNGSGTAFVQRNGVAGTFGSQTAVNGVASMISHQGRLYIGTKRIGGSSLGGGIYVYASGASYNTWNLAHTTAGTPCVNAAVDEVPTMTSFNGSLIFTTRKGYNDRSEVCRLSGGGDAGAVRLNESGNTGNYDVTQGDVTNVASMGAQLVYNNRLLFGTRDSNGATVLGLENIQVPANLGGFEQYTNATEGTITQGLTSAIDGVTAMAVYNGTLYIGTEENGAAGAGGAEVYKYLGDDKWGRVSQATAGTIASGGTTGIATINKLISWNGKLYAMTSRGGSLSRGVGGAEIYEYTGPELQQSSHALIFHSANSGQSGGEQAGYENIGSIFFNATASAGLNNQGAFIFSHGIVTANGGFDVAEDYPTHDDGLSPGDLVAMSQDDVGFVERAKGKYNDKIIGVYSEKPGFRLAQDKDGFIDGYKAVAVALVGRVPIKASGENGPIAVGDYLTSSATPGVAMKATKSGAVIGQAMEAYDGTGVEKILVYVTKGISSGTRLSSMLSGLQVDQVAQAGLNHIFGKQILAALLTQLPELERKTDFSEILTDRIAAGLEIVTPKVTAHEVSLDEISLATGSAISVRLGTDGSMVVLGKDDKEVIRFDNEGNAFFKGTLQADKIKANQIEGLEFIESRIKNQELGMASLSALFAQAPSISPTPVLTSSSGTVGAQGVASDVLAASIAAEIDQLSTLLTKPDPQPTFSLQSFETGGIARLDSLEARQATVSGNLRVKGSGFVEGILTVVDTLMTKDLLVSGISQFLGDVVFKEKVEFSKSPVFNTDTAGIAQIHKGHQFVNVAFETPYEDAPVVQASIISHELTGDEYNDLLTDNICDKARGKDACQEVVDNAVLLNNARFLLTKKSEKGFTIKLGKNAEHDIWFSWTALDVKEKRTIESKPTPSAEGR